jgi:hypothetical protein
MAFLQKLQNKLIELYQEFPDDIEEINISMKLDKLTIATEDQLLEVVPEINKRINFAPYLLEFFNAEMDFDFGLYAETDLRKLLEYINNRNNPNGKRLLAYSLLETKMDQMIFRMGKRNFLTTLKRCTSQSISRMRVIAKRANKLMEITNEFPIRLTTMVTPRWLYRMTNDEFDQLLQKCRRMNNLENHFAGAQS